MRYNQGLFIKDVVQNVTDLRMNEMKGHEAVKSKSDLSKLFKSKEILENDSGINDLIKNE